MNKNEILEFRASYDDFSESMTYRVLSHRNGQKTVFLSTLLYYDYEERQISHLPAIAPYVLVGNDGSLLYGCTGIRVA